MSGSNFVRKYTISKQSGPVYINSYALKGIGVQYRNPSSSFDPISLPAGWTPPLLQDSYSINLSLENSVLEQAKARRQAIVGEVPDPNSSLKANGINPVSLAGGLPLIPYQSSGILTPTPINSEVNPSATNDGSPPDPLTKPLGEMSLRDFEGDSNDPFETTALQAIDVFSELQSVLQPELAANTTQQPSPVQTQAPPTSNVPVPSSHSSSNVSTTPPYSFHAQPVVTQPPEYSTSVPTGSSNVNQPLHVNFRPPPGGVGVLVDFGTRDQLRDTPPSSVAASTTSQPSIASPVVSSSRPRPPLVMPKPTGSPLMMPKSTGPRPPPTLPKPQVNFPPAVNNPAPPYSGVPVLPSNQEPLPPAYTEQPYSQPFQQDDLYTSSPFVVRSNPPENPQFQLPDIQSSLSTDEREAVYSISAMGFPTPRVARAYKRLDGDNQAVLDFLCLVGDLEEKGHNGDSAEVALLANDTDAAKSLDYLNHITQYKEMWPEDSIHSAYQESGKDWEKTIDILTQ